MFPIKRKTKTDMADPMGMDVNQDEANIGPQDDSALPPTEPIPDEADAIPDGAKAQEEAEMDAEPAGETAESEAEEFINKFIAGLEETSELEYAKSCIEKALAAKQGTPEISANY